VEVSSAPRGVSVGFGFTWQARDKSRPAPSALSLAHNSE